MTSLAQSLIQVLGNPLGSLAFTSAPITTVAGFQSVETSRNERLAEIENTFKRASRQFGASPKEVAARRERGRHRRTARLNEVAVQGSRTGRSKRSVVSTEPEPLTTEALISTTVTEDPVEVRKHILDNILSKRMKLGDLEKEFPITVVARTAHDLKRVHKEIEGYTKKIRKVLQRPNEVRPGSTKFDIDLKKFVFPENLPKTLPAEKVSEDLHILHKGIVGMLENEMKYTLEEEYGLPVEWKDRLTGKAVFEAVDSVVSNIPKDQEVPVEEIRNITMNGWERCQRDLESALHKLAMSRPHANWRQSNWYTTIVYEQLWLNLRLITTAEHARRLTLAAVGIQTEDVMHLSTRFGDYTYMMDLNPEDNQVETHLGLNQAEFESVLLCLISDSSAKDVTPHSEDKPINSTALENIRMEHIGPRKKNRYLITNLLTGQVITLRRIDEYQHDPTLLLKDHDNPWLTKILGTYSHVYQMPASVRHSHQTTITLPSARHCSVWVAERVMNPLNSVIRWGKKEHIRHLFLGAAGIVETLLKEDKAPKRLVVGNFEVSQDSEPGKPKMQFVLGNNVVVILDTAVLPEKASVRAGQWAKNALKSFTRSVLKHASKTVTGSKHFLELVDMIETQLDDRSASDIINIVRESKFVKHRPTRRRYEANHR